MALDHETLRLQRQALQEALQQLSSADTDLLAAWCRRARAWAEIADVFGDLGRDDGKGAGICPAGCFATSGGWIYFVYTS